MEPTLLKAISEPRLTHFAELQPFTDKLLALAEPVAPTEVFRFAAPCANKGCYHCNGKNCRLATQIMQTLSPVVDALPVCVLRSRCRWQQHGRAACLRWSQVVTDIYLETKE